METNENAPLIAPDLLSWLGDEGLHAVLSPFEVALFSRCGIKRVLKPGEALFRLGDEARSMFVVLSGSVELEFGEGLTQNYLGPNEFVGELGLVKPGHLRAANAYAASALEVLEITQSGFSALVQEDPTMMVDFLRRAIMRLINSEEHLIAQLRNRNRDLETVLGNLYEANDRLSHTEMLVRTDELTGLYNRRGLTIYLQQNRRAGHMPEGLILIDGDQFKQINDLHGHLAGDRALQSLGNILRSVARQEDLACRLGGDEFCLLIHSADARRLSATMDFILHAVRKLMEREASVPRICAVSIGACMVTTDDSWNDAYNRADQALYEAKRGGGNQARWYVTQRNSLRAMS
jgi:diguanylate cyclase (GGDEF)-like protein